MQMDVNLTPADRTWIAICVYHEARGEPMEGQVAVACVVMTRMRQRRKSARDIVLQPMQFSWANGGSRPAITDYSALQRAFEAVDTATRGDIVDGADHYHTAGVDPAWDDEMILVREIGNHIFYRSK